MLNGETRVHVELERFRFSLVCGKIMSLRDDAQRQRSNLYRPAKTTLQDGRADFRPLAMTKTGGELS